VRLKLSNGFFEISIDVISWSRNKFQEDLYWWFLDNDAIITFTYSDSHFSNLVPSVLDYPIYLGLEGVLRDQNSCSRRPNEFLWAQIPEFSQKSCFQFKERNLLGYTAIKYNVSAPDIH